MHSNLRTTDLSLGYTREGDFILLALCVPVSVGGGKGTLLVSMEKLGAQHLHEGTSKGSAVGLCHASQYR